MFRKFYRVLRYREKADSIRYVNFLRKKGVTIGKNCRFFDPISNIVDLQNPYCIEIGDNVSITSNVILLTHDYSWSVLTNINHQMFGGIGNLKIGNNVFIGMGSIILKSTEIGDNVIIGAGSVVSGLLDSNSVYAGNPAKKIMDLDTFLQKKSDRQLQEAVSLAKQIKKIKGRVPTCEEMKEYFWLFTKPDHLTDSMQRQIKNIGASEAVFEELYSLESQSRFNSFEEFLDFCWKE